MRQKEFEDAAQRFATYCRNASDEELDDLRYWLRLSWQRLNHGGYAYVHADRTRLGAFPMTDDLRIEVRPWGRTTRRGRCDVRVRIPGFAPFGLARTYQLFRAADAEDDRRIAERKAVQG